MQAMIYSMVNYIAIKLVLSLCFWGLRSYWYWMPYRVDMRLECEFGALNANLWFTLNLESAGESKYKILGK